MAREGGRGRAAEDAQANGEIGTGIEKDRAVAVQAWERIAESLSRSESPEDRALADYVDRFLSFTFEIESKRRPEVVPESQRITQIVRQPSHLVTRDREGPEIQR